MKKIKFYAIAILAFVLIGLAGTAFAMTQEEQETWLKSVNSTPVYLLEDAQCKTVTYSPWSACMPGFNLQIRYITETPGGCPPTTKQQVETLRYCDSGEVFYGYFSK